LCSVRAHRFNRALPQNRKGKFPCQ
jgi:hypothetical protein